MDAFSQLAPVVIIFFILALASKQFGDYFAKARLPLITGFLFTGMVVGPSVLGLIKTEAVANLRFVDQVSLAVIAFAAGAELRMKELRGRLKSIAWVTVGNISVIFLLGALAVVLFADSIPFLEEAPTTGRVAAGILAGAILVARSPSSAIAIVAELRAKGPFTQLALGVTMIIDVAVIVLFAINSSVASSLISGAGFDLLFIAVLVGEIMVSVGIGFGLGKLLGFVLGTRLYGFGKIALILVSGYGIFVLAESLHEYSHHHLPFTIFLEPLLICMVAGFSVVNFTRFEQRFERILHDVGPPVFVAFFTLTGASLSLEVLKDTWAIAAILVGVRLVGIVAGSFLGGTLAGDPPQHNRWSWMAFITQAGVGLGLAKEVAVKFPTWGEEFATVIIAVIVVNQIAGPPFFKWVLQIVGEARLGQKQEPEPFDGIRDAIIFGLANNAYLLARQLASHGWQVRIVTRKFDQIKKFPDAHGFIHHVPDFSLESLKTLETGKAETVVCMFASDDKSLEVCQAVRRHFKVKDLVVRLNDVTNLDRFHGLDALVVDPASAMINMLDHLVRAPVATSLILGLDQEHDVVGLELRDPDLEGLMLHELRLPFDVAVMSINRSGEMISPHADTELFLGDWITLVGSPESLEAAGLIFDVNFSMGELETASGAAPALEPPNRLSRPNQVVFSMEDYLDAEMMRAGLEVGDRRELFRKIAEIYTQAHGGDTTAVEAAVLAGDERQDVLVGDELAVSYAVVEGLERTYLGVLTLKEPVEYRGGERADVIVFMLGPPEDRPNYLKLLANTASMCAKAGLIGKLRGVDSDSRVLGTVQECHRKALRV